MSDCSGRGNVLCFRCWGIVRCGCRCGIVKRYCTCKAPDVPVIEVQEMSPNKFDVEEVRKPLLRCCIISLAHIRGQRTRLPKEGQTETCSDCSQQVVFKSGAWEPLIKSSN